MCEVQLDGQQDDQGHRQEGWRHHRGSLPPGQEVVQLTAVPDGHTHAGYFRHARSLQAGDHAEVLRLREGNDRREEYQKGVQVVLGGLSYPNQVLKERTASTRTNPDDYTEVGFARGIILVYESTTYYGSLLIFGGVGGYLSQIFIGGTSLYFRSANANPSFSSWNSWVKVV